MDFTVDGHNGSQTTGPQARDRLQSKHAVIRRLFLTEQAQILINRVVNRSGLADMAGRAGTNLDDVLALCFQREVLIERGNTVHLCGTDVQLLRNQYQSFLAEIVELSLDPLHDRNQIRLLAIICLNYCVYFV